MMTQRKLYCDLDPTLVKEVEQNPVLLLERMNYEKLVALAHDENFVYKMDAVYSAFKKIRRCGTGSPAPVNSLFQHGIRLG